MNSSSFNILTTSMEQDSDGRCSDHPDKECMIVNGMTLNCCEGKTSTCKTEVIDRLTRIFKQVCELVDEQYTDNFKLRNKSMIDNNSIQFLINIINDAHIKQYIPRSINPFELGFGAIKTTAEQIVFAYHKYFLVIKLYSQYAIINRYAAKK